MLNRIILIFTFLLIQICAPSRGLADIILPGDELTLPPLLNRIMNGDLTPAERLNVKSIDQKKHEAKVGEWLDFGDSIELLGRMSAQIIQKENLMWAGGGVLSAQIGSGSRTQDDLVYDLTVKRGWVKIFIKPDPDHPTLKIHTDHGVFSVQDAELWLSTRPAQTEIYLLRGQVRAEPFKTDLIDRSYAIFEKSQPKPRYIAKDWDPGQIEVKIAAGYPGLVRLANLAHEEWENGKTAQIYATFRKKGWRKSSHLDPLAK